MHFLLSPTNKKTIFYFVQSLCRFLPFRPSRRLAKYSTESHVMVRRDRRSGRLLGMIRLRDRRAHCGCFSSSGSLAMLMAIRRASSRVSRLAAVGGASRPDSLYHWGCRSALRDVIPPKGARYEDTCVDRCTALDGLAGRRTATATTGAWCRRPDKHFDPSKQRSSMYRGNGCDFLQPTHQPEPRGLRIEHRVCRIECHVRNERRLRIERRGRSWCRLKPWY
jgi:hypothetical protein